MSYSTYIAKPISEKIILVEIDIPEITESVFINAEPGIWFTTWSVNVDNATYNFGAGAFGFGAFGSAGVADLSNGNPENVHINSFYAGDEWYTKVTNLEDLRIVDKSFYYADHKLYIHFPNHAPPDSYTDFRIGVGLGYANKAAYYDHIYYDARVISVPAITRNKDPLFFGKISFDGGTITLDNADGEFDTFQSDHEVYGATLRILLGFEDNAYSEFKTMYEGYIENLRLTEDVFEIDANDKRKALSRKIPTSLFTITAYPNMDSKYNNKPIPLLYGACDNVPIICVNEKQSGMTSFTFVVADTTDRALTAIDAIRVNGAVISAATISLTAGTFTLATTAYATGHTVTADVRGYASGGSLIENGLEIIRDILANQFDMPHISTFYNLSGWASAEAAAANVAIFIADAKEGWKVIEDISYSLHGNFIVQDDGKFNFRSYDPNRTVDQIINTWELLNPVYEVDYDTSELLTSCRIGYDKDWDEGIYTELRYATAETAIADAYKVYRERAFETLLVASGSAETFAEAIMAVSDAVRPIFRVKINMQSVDREISDMVNVQYGTPTRDFVGWMSAEVIGKTVDLDAMTVELTLRKT